ncbi:MAG: hypothetical protein ACRDGM_16440 [bacterium]
MTTGRKLPAARAGKTKRATEAPTVREVSSRRCGLCGKTRKLTRTECCGHWICDDEDSYVIFSYARNSCFRNHRRYTLCGYHSSEEHPGDWRKCQQCRKQIEAEMYVYYGTNEYNFVKLENPPSYEPTRCKQCGKVIRLAEDAYTMKGKGYYCARCSPVLR